MVRQEHVWGQKESLVSPGHQEGKETEDNLVSQVLQANQEPQVPEV